MGNPLTGGRLWRTWPGRDPEATQGKSGPGKEPRQLLCTETGQRQSRGPAVQGHPEERGGMEQSPLCRPGLSQRAGGMSVPVTCPPARPTAPRFPTAPAGPWQNAQTRGKHFDKQWRFRCHALDKSSSPLNGALPLLRGGTGHGRSVGSPLTPLFPFQAEQRLRPGGLRPGGGCWGVGECQVLRVRSPASPVPLHPVVLRQPKRPFTCELQFPLESIQATI